MRQLSDAELARLPFFKVVCSTIGEIEFEEPVDVKNVCIDDIIQFKKGCCQVYFNRKKKEKPAVVTEIFVFFFQYTEVLNGKLYHVSSRQNVKMFFSFPL